MKAFDLSVSYFKEGKFEEALEEINKCLNEEANNLEYRFFRARVSSRLGKFEAALADFDHLIGLEPFNPTYISDRAVVLHLLKRNQEAMEEFDRALNLEPLNPYRYSSRAYFKDRIGDLKGAIEDYEKAIELDPEDAVAYNNKGIIEEKMGYMKQSKKSFNKADDLIGYKGPSSTKETIEQESKSNFPPIGKPLDNEDKEKETSEKKLSFSGYFDILKGVFTNKHTQKEFIDFIRSGFKKRT